MLRALVTGVVCASCGAFATILGLVHWNAVEVLLGLLISAFGWAFLAGFRAGKARGDPW